MNPALLAQLAAPTSIAGWAIWLIVIAGIVAVVYVILGRLGIAVPPWIQQLFWIVVAVVIGVAVIKFIASI